MTQTALPLKNGGSAFFRICDMRFAPVRIRRQVVPFQNRYRRDVVGAVPYIHIGTFPGAAEPGAGTETGHLYR